MTYLTYFWYSISQGEITGFYNEIFPFEVMSAFESMQ